MNYETVMIVSAIITLAVQTLIIIVAGIWKLSRVENSIRKEIADHRLESDEKVNGALRNVGETFTALRQKITEVELYIRDKYLQKESFQLVVSQIMSDMKTMGGEIKERLLRMENKLDRAAHRYDTDHGSNE